MGESMETWMDHEDAHPGTSYLDGDNRWIEAPGGHQVDKGNEDGLEEWI